MSALNFENRVTHLFIAKGIARTANVTPSTLADGEVAFFSRGGSKTLTGDSGSFPASAETDGLVIMQGRGGTNPPLKSAVIKPANIRSIKAVPYNPAYEQIDYIGYNGNSGAIDVINDNPYIVRLVVRDHTSFSHRQYKILDIPYKSDASATQTEIADGLTLAAIKTISRQPEKEILWERVCSHAGTSIGATNDTVVGVKGSKYVEITDVGGDNSIVGTIAAGDYFRAGVSTFDPVYKIVSSTVTTAGGTIELDVPLQESFSAFGNNAEFITAAQAASSDFGLKLTGRKLSFSLGRDEYRKVTFETTLLDDFGNTAVTKEQGAYPGVGEYEQVAELEWFCQGNENMNFYRSNSNGPVVTPRADASSSSTYSLISIEYDIETTGGLSGSVKSPATVMIALDRNSNNFSGDTNIEASVGNNTSSVLDAINSLLVTTLGGTALTNAGVY